jgi:hypothetical protein
MDICDDNEISHWGEIETDGNEQSAVADFDFDSIFADLEDLPGSLLPLNFLQPKTLVL